MGRQNFTVVGEDSANTSKTNVKVRPSWTHKEKVEYKDKILNFLRENYKTIKVPVHRHLPPSTSFGYIEKYKDEEMSKLIHFLFLTDEDILNAIEIIKDLKQKLFKRIDYNYKNLQSVTPKEAF